MNINELTIGQAKELAAMFGSAAPVAAGGTLSRTHHGLQIVILDRGFVYVGDVTIDGDWVLIENAKNIRVWGTTKGLGELAKDGPTKSTVLDFTGTVRSPIRALIGLINCEKSKWI